MLIKYKYSKKFKQPWANDWYSYSELYKRTMGWYQHNKDYLRHKCAVKGVYGYTLSILDFNARLVIKPFWKFAKNPAYKKRRHLYKIKSHFADDSKVTDYYTTCTTTDAVIKENKFHMFKHKNKPYEIVDCFGDNDTLYNDNDERSTATFNVPTEVTPISFEGQIAHLKEDMAFDVDNPKYQRIEKLVDNFEKQRYNLNSLKGKDDQNE